MRDSYLFVWAMKRLRRDGVNLTPESERELVRLLRHFDDCMREFERDAIKARFEVV